MPDLLTAHDLRVTYGRGRNANEVLKGVSVEIGQGETLGLVGESGSGKTTLGRAVLGLVPVAGGTLTFAGEDVTRLGARGRRRLARDIQVVFQDPYTSLNPSMTIRDILTEPLVAQGAKKKDAASTVRALLDQVAMPADALDRYSREFSGGQRQRIAIARALALDPKLIVCDEPVSALDLSTQLKVLDLFIELQQRTGVAYLFISHDLSVVRHVSHRVAVMYRGHIVETGPALQVTDDPQHPYTQRLWAANLVADPAEQANRRAVRQSLPPLDDDALAAAGAT
ncbi:ATP-binding cassette domain-containing protein [Jiangella anatolica]|uniref:Peptide ABC transporter ATP-binding protein n=1 Tax=Jiangella anatolica TaxID=2670374 RepID=A0A2W2C0G0_9ACTN|nr:ABC transporter ATP-binding protein [Jiangella anatolica]PZF85588.1 peptide ABC transporter ATP-binding protein [Jiangella anatolica]